jgi:hypothetical protein
MSARGGKRNGAGRPSGAVNKTTAIGKEAILKAAEEGITPLEFLLSTMRNEGEEFGTRLDAAKAAAPYMHPRLSTIEHGNNPDSPLFPERVEVTVVRPKA